MVLLLTWKKRSNSFRGMSIIDSSTTGHSRPQERKVANRLYAGIAIAVAVALVCAIIIGRSRSLNPLKTDEASQQSMSTNPQPISEQPRR